MKTDNFESNKPQTKQFQHLMPDFIKGYEATKEFLKSYSVEEVKKQFNTVYPIGCKFSSMAAYFYAKGELAAILDNI